MYIPNEDTQSYPFYRLQLVVETFGHILSYILSLTDNLLIHKSLYKHYTELINIHNMIN